MDEGDKLIAELKKWVRSQQDEDCYEARDAEGRLVDLMMWRDCIEPSIERKEMAAWTLRMLEAVENIERIKKEQK